jgi:hypothetical protein
MGIGETYFECQKRFFGRGVVKKSAANGASGAEVGSFASLSAAASVSLAGSGDPGSSMGSTDRMSLAIAAAAA